MSNKTLLTLGGERYLNRVNYQYIMSSDYAQQYPGLLGAEHTLSQEDAERLTDITVTDYSASTKLAAGTYKLVKLKSTASVAAKRGCLVYWDTSADPSAFQVTTDVIGANGAVAGVLCNVITAGYYGFIQVDGIAWCLGKSSALTATGATGQPLFAVTDTQGRVDNVADATSVTEAILQTLVGAAWDVPVAATLKRVALSIRMKVPSVGNF